MKILPINQYRSFKSLDPKKSFGDDDAISQLRRTYIREHYLKETFPLYYNSNNSGRLEEYELKQLLASLCGKKVRSDSLESVFKTLKPENMELPAKFLIPEKGGLANDIIQNLPILNLDLVSQKMGVYRGATLQASSKNLLDMIKQAGIERIIDLAGYESLEDSCKDIGLEYLYYSTPSYYLISGEMFKTKANCKESALLQSRLFALSKKETNAFVERSITSWEQNIKEELNDFVKFITTMQKGHLYIGCEYGTYTTDNALMLNAYFNPLYIKCSKYVTPYNKSLTNRLINLYQNLSTEHKNLMGWTKDFDALTKKALLALK